MKAVLLIILVLVLLAVATPVYPCIRTVRAEA